MRIINLLIKMLPFALRKQIKNFWILSKKYCQYNSIFQKKSLNTKSEVLPWYTYPAIEYLSSLDFSESEVLEFGAGSSSVWWASRSKSVLAVEHNREWAETLQKKISNLHIEFASTESEYLNAGVGNKFDVVIIDGVWRQECVDLAGTLLNENGIVILDNADWHPLAARKLREELNLLQVDFHGFGPINDYTWTTSIFFKRSFNCRSNTERLPQYSVGALKKVAKGQEN